MTILVIGGTGQVGSSLLEHLAARGQTARVLTRDGDGSKLPKGFEPVIGDPLDPPSMRRALEGITAAFLLVPVVPDEATRTLLALDAMREAQVEHIVYLSQVVLDYVDCPHTAAKAAAETMIERLHLPATVLRPAYFFQNDLGEKDAILGGRYLPPIGSRGVSMVDVRDIAEVAAIALVDRGALGEDPIIDIVGPDALTGQDVAAIWSEALSRPIVYGGDDWAAAEARSAQRLPSWGARDIALMFRGVIGLGMLGRPGAVERLSTLFGRPPRSYQSFAAEQRVQWQGSAS